MKQLIALAVIAAGMLSAAQAEIPAGQLIADVPDDIADRLIADGLARIAEPDTESQAPKQIRQPSAKPVRARVLVDCDVGRVNDVVELPADQAKQLQAAGTIDTDKAAVAYALSLRTAD